MSKVDIKEGINGEIKEGIKLTKRQKEILQVLLKEDLINSKEIVNRIDISQKTLEKNLAKLKNLNLINFEGSRKTGGYRLTEESKNFLNH